VIPVLRRILALVMAAALLAAGVILIVEVVAAWFNAGPVVLSDTATTTWRTTGWDDAAVVWTAIIVGVVGLLCLVAALWPDRPTTVPSRLDHVELERRPLEQTLRHELQSVDGVADANVRVRRDHAKARVDTNWMLDPGAVETASQARLTETAHRLSVAAEPQLTMRAKRVPS
jgi:Family of unknown function (DUF6286)